MSLNRRSKSNLLSDCMLHALRHVPDDWQPTPAIVFNGTARALAARGYAEVRPMKNRLYALEWRKPPSRSHGGEQ